MIPKSGIRFSDQIMRKARLSTFSVPAAAEFEDAPATRKEKP
jgi:hypothetical protein